MRTNIDQSFNQEEFKQGLKNWVSQAQAGERREEAARRILECKNKNLSSLDLGRLGLESIPEEIGYLTSLTNLNLSWNRLTTIPDSIVNLASLF